MTSNHLNLNKYKMPDGSYIMKLKDGNRLKIIHISSDDFIGFKGMLEDDYDDTLVGKCKITTDPKEDTLNIETLKAILETIKTETGLKYHIEDLKVS